MKLVATIRRENLDILASEHGTMERVAEISGASPVYLSQIKNQTLDLKTGKPRQMGNITARRLEKGCKKPEGWMDTEHSPDATTPLQAVQPVVIPSLSPTPIPGQPSISVPLLANSGSMGDGENELHEDVIVGQIELDQGWALKRFRAARHGALRFIHAYGDSMLPTFSDGDILLVDTEARDPSGADGVYVLRTSRRIFIKRVTERYDGSGWDITSDNPAVKTTGLLNGESQTIVLGRVVWAWNGRKL
ncbi:S24 family peptidase [Comamonas humi]